MYPIPDKRQRLKDSDVTWLYGPLHTAADPVPPARVATTEDRLDLVKAMGKKPILKHRSISELLSIPRGSSPSLEASHIEVLEGYESPRPVLHQTKSESYITRTGIRRVSPPLPDHAPDLIAGEETADSPKPPSDTDSVSNNTRRHISFNTFVEQCIAVDKPVHATHDHHPPWRLGFGALSYSGVDDDENDAIYEDDEDAVLTMRSTSSSGQSSISSSRRPSLSSNSRSNSHSSERATIQAIAPTMLKTHYDSAPGDLPAVVYVPPLGSPYDPTIATNSVVHQSSSSVISGQATLRFDGPPSRHLPQNDCEGRGVGFDYFGGSDGRMEGYESAKASPRAVSTSQVGLASPHAGPFGSVSRVVASQVAVPNSPPISPSKSNKLPGKSILKSTFPDAAIAEALRESIDKPDQYLPKGPNFTPSSPTYGESVSQILEPVKGRSAFPTSPDPYTTGILSSTSSEHLNPSAGIPVRGRSAVRTPGTAIGIADRERSASSKGSSPIGSVSPNSRPIAAGSSGKPSVVKVVSRTGKGHLAASPPSSRNTRSPSQCTISSSTSSERSSSPRSNGSMGDAHIRREAAGSKVSSNREETFQPSKSTPVQSPTPKKRLSMDIVPVLPAQSQPAQPQLSQSDASRQYISKSPTVGGNLSAELAARRTTPSHSEDVDGLDGADGCTFRSADPIPLNSPSNDLSPLPTASSASTSSAVLNGASTRANNAPSVRVHGDLSNTRSRLEDPHPDGIDGGGDARDEGTLVSRAVDIVTSARGLFGAIWSAGANQNSAPVEPHSAVNGRNLFDQ